MNDKSLNFAYKVRHALNENLDNLPTSTTDRLGAARKIALARKKQGSGLQLRATRTVPALAGGFGFFSDPVSWFGRVGLAIPIIVLALGIVGIYKSEQQSRIIETADIDAAVLSDELPLSAYLDHGFNEYLAKRMD